MSDDFHNKNISLSDYILCYILISISGVNFFLGNKFIAIIFSITLLRYFKMIRLTKFLGFYLLAVTLIL